MGCDIHTYVERKIKGKWVKYNGEHFTNSYCNNDEKDNAPFGWRSYRMFGFLANVRDESIKPIKQPTHKFPDNVSKGVLKEWQHWEEGDGHTISYITLRELVEFDFNQDLINSEQKFSTNSRNVIFEKIPSLSKNNDNEFWRPKNYYDIFGGPDSTFFKHIEELSELGGLDDVRVVFWFDN